MQRVRSVSVVALLTAALMTLAGSIIVTSASASAAQTSKKPPKVKRLKKAPKATSVAEFTARGSVGDAYVEDAARGTKLMLVNRRNRIVAEGKADSFGSKIFYDERPGGGYRVLGR